MLLTGEKQMLQRMLSCCQPAGFQGWQTLMLQACCLLLQSSMLHPLHAQAIKKLYVMLPTMRTRGCCIQEAVQTFQPPSWWHEASSESACDRTAHHCTCVPRLATSNGRLSPPKPGRYLCRCSCKAATAGNKHVPDCKGFMRPWHLIAEAKSCGCRCL